QGAFPLGSLPEQHVLAEAFVHAAQAVGIPFTDDLTGETNEGCGFVPVSQRRGRRFSVLDGYLRPARRRPNLTIATDALGTRILVEGGRAGGVACRGGGVGGGPGREGEPSEKEARCAGEVVLCAGAIGSPQVLQLSGIGPRDALAPVGLGVVDDVPRVET